MLNKSNVGMDPGVLTAALIVKSGRTHGFAPTKAILIFVALFSFFLSFLCKAESLSPLPADKAFAFSAYLDKDNQLILQWDIAPGYYLYRNQLKLAPAGLSSLQTNKINLPVGSFKYDALHGNYQAYVGTLKIPVHFLPSKKGVLDLNINYQGCSSGGFCYTPIKKTLKVDLSQVKVPQNLNQYVQSVHETANEPANSNAIASLFVGHPFWLIILSFLGLGLLLAFTPCVLPMIPILSGIIVGQRKKATPKKSFTLSLMYVAGMAITYAIAGIVVALIGSSIQAQLQKPWIMVLFSGLFVLLALSLFGFYELQLPARWQKLLTALSNKQKGGTYFSVFLMGCLSTLIVSPCVSAPLVGVLAYIGQTGDVMLGGFALLALGIGMGIPLLLIGISADRLLPKTGAWMVLVEKVFGFIMLGFAIWMLSRMIPGPVTLFLWSMLFIVAAIFFAVFSPVPTRLHWLAKSGAVILLVYGMILIVGAVTGNSDLFHPWAQLGQSRQSALRTPSFTLVSSMEELDQHLVDARQSKQKVLLDFYADWCTSCVLMDRTVFSRDDVRKALINYQALRVDVTANNAFDQAVLKRFHVIGPPTIIVFDIEGQELTGERIVGEVNAKEFLQRIK